MLQRIGLSGLVILAGGLFLAMYQAGSVPGKEPGQAQGGAGAKVGDLNQVSLQVAALKILASLDATPAQLAKLAEVVKSEGLAKTEARRPFKANAKFRQNLLLLRDALVENDADGVKYFSDKVDNLRDADDVDLDDTVETTAAARSKVAAALRLLTPIQVTSYLSAYGDTLPDPVRRIIKTVEDGQKAESKDWQQQRDDAATDVGWLVAGFNMKNATQVANDARKLLDEGHRIKGDDLQKQKLELEEKIREKILARVTPLTVLFHIMEHDLAELLSNPQLPDALSARLAAAK
jgi:hypothetical protein